MVSANGGLETVEGYVRRDLCSGKGTATGIWQAWRGRGAGGFIRI